MATKVKPRTHVLFCADVDTVAGTFHLPFALTPGQYVALYDVNGDLVDEVTIPSDLQPNQSYARCSEDCIDLHGEHKFIAKDWEVRDESCIAKAITPGKFNARPINENIQKFKDEDPSGILLTLMSMGVVFSALLMLYLLFKLFGKIFTAKEKKKEETIVDKAVDNETITVAAKSEGDDEAIAAEMNETFVVGEKVKVTDGPFNGFNGVISDVMTDKHKLKVIVTIFDRQTPLELGFNQVEVE